MILTLIIAVFIYVHIFFLMSVVSKNYALMDIGWGLGFIMIAWISYIYYPMSLKNALILLVVTIWGLRLSYYLTRRNLGKAEDERYQNLRREWGQAANREAYFKIFLFQGVLMLIISLPVIAGMREKSDTLSLINKVGLMIWSLGLTLEAFSDAYLTWFKKNPDNKGKICTTGPWRFCRFPNYLGEITLWYGVYFLCFEPVTFWTILGPLTINFLIVKVTGIPLLEKKYLVRDDYQKYAATVPRLIPWK